MNSIGVPNLCLSVLNNSTTATSAVRTSAVVALQDQQRGFAISAITMTMRCCCPAPQLLRTAAQGPFEVAQRDVGHHRQGSGVPRRRSTPWWIIATSTNWRLTVTTGFRDGLCWIVAISRPWLARKSRADTARRSRGLHRIDQPTTPFTPRVSVLIKRFSVPIFDPP
jgi:hypothetical protein